MKDILVKVKNLYKHFPITAGLFSKPIGSVKAVSDVNLEIYKGETLGLVGESGCGKSTLGRCILRLLDCTQGEIYYQGEDITHLKKLKPLRKKMQIIFQDPYASLNPKMKIGHIIAEPLVIHRLYDSRQDRHDRVKQLLETVGLRSDMMHRYPYEFSGGQRQRIGIARALAVDPEFIICDEPVSALDVSIQAQVINLLMDIQQKLGLTYLFIAHDLKVVKHISHRVAVMYLGRIVEMASSFELYKNPQHPYTKALMTSIPIPNPQIKRKSIVLKGDVPSPIHPPQGCSFHPRCPIATQACQKQIPPLIVTNNQQDAKHQDARHQDAKHQTACIHL